MKAIFFTLLYLVLSSYTVQAMAGELIINTDLEFFYEGNFNKKFEEIPGLKGSILSTLKNSQLLHSVNEFPEVVNNLNKMGADLKSIKGVFKGQKILGRCITAGKLRKENNKQGFKSFSVATYTNVRGAEIITEFDTVIKNIGKQFANCIYSEQGGAIEVSDPSNCPATESQRKSALAKLTEIKSTLENKFSFIEAKADANYRSANNTNTSLSDYLDRGCGKNSSLGHKALNFVKKNKYIIGGAVGLAYLIDRDERKQKNKIKRAEEEKLVAEIEACSDVNKVGGSQCAQLFAEKCLADSTERGCAEYTSALCEEAGSSGNPVGVSRPYCVLKNSQKFCTGDAATTNATSPACQWVNNLPEACTENPAAPQCFARFENQHVFAAVCNRNEVDPLCTHVTTPSPEPKLIVFGPATNFNGGANTGVVVSNQGRAPSSGVFADLSQTNTAAVPAADVASPDASLFSSSSVSEACLNQQLTSCGI